MTTNRTVCIDARVLEQVREALAAAAEWDAWPAGAACRDALPLLDAAAQPTQPSEAEERLAYAIDVMHFLADHVPLDGCENCIEMLAEFGIVPAALTDAPAPPDGDEHG